jgi:transposase
VAARFGVAASTVVKWSQRYRATGSVAPGKVGGHRRPVLDAHRAFIRERIDQTPHLTLHKLKDELAVRGVIVSHNAVWTFLRREGLSFKSTRPVPLSITHKFHSDHCAQGDVSKPWQTSPHDGISGRRIVGTSEIAAEPSD